MFNLQINGLQSYMWRWLAEIAICRHFSIFATTMEKSELLELSRQMRRSALEMLDHLNIEKSCHHVGGTMNVVGSLKTDLMLNHRDVDLHIYTGEPIIEKSFSFMNKVAENEAVKDIQYKNLLDTKEECIEWHLWCEGKDKSIWKFDIIHIRKGSFYDGFFEKVTDRIIEKLKPETKEAILQIKYELGGKSAVQGIQVYHAVLGHGIKNYEDFIQWSKENPVNTVLDWIP